MHLTHCPCRNRSWVLWPPEIHLTTRSAQCVHKTLTAPPSSRYPASLPPSHWSALECGGAGCAPDPPSLRVGHRRRPPPPPRTHPPAVRPRWCTPPPPGGGQTPRDS